MKVQNSMHDWIRYILYTGGDEHGNQTVQKKTTVSLLCQDGSSLTTAPSAAVPAQHWFPAMHASTSVLLVNPFSKDRSKSFLNSWNEATSPKQSQLQGKCSSYPAL